MNIHAQELQSLEERLAAAYMRKNELEQEIQRLAPTGIQSLPTELLMELFEMVVASNLLPLHYIRSVCRAWNMVATQTPRLWSYIHITVPSRIEGVDRCIESCSKCIDRSEQLPLDISLTYTTFPPARQVLEERFTQAFSDTTIFKGVQEWGLSGLVNNYGEPSYVGYPPSFGTIFDYGWLLHLGPLSTLIGQTGIHMSRWGSFQFAWPDELIQRMHLFNMVFSQGIKIHPSLKSLTLRSLQPYHYGQIKWDFPITVVNPQEQTLHHLTIENFIPAGFKAETINPLPLRRLYIFRYNFDILMFILKCKNLEYLRIGHALGPVQAQIERLGINDLGITIFGHLSTLYINHWLPSNIFRFIMLPQLRRMIISTQICFYYKYEYLHLRSKNLFPSLEVLDVRWWIKQIDYYGTELLRFILSNSPIIHTIVIDKLLLQSFLLVMAKLWKEDIRPSRLRSLLLVDIEATGAQSDMEPLIVDTMPLSPSVFETHS